MYYEISCLLVKMTPVLFFPQNEYMKDDFFIKIETWHKPDLGTTDNVSWWDSVNVWCRLLLALLVYRRNVLSNGKKTPETDFFFLPCSVFSLASRSSTWRVGGDWSSSNWYRWSLSDGWFCKSDQEIQVITALLAGGTAGYCRVKTYILSLFLLPGDL